MSQKTTLTRIGNDNYRAFVDMNQWSIVQSAGGTIDDGRLAAMRAYLHVNLPNPGKTQIFYRDNGQIIVASSTQKAVAVAEAFITGWQRCKSFTS